MPGNIPIAHGWEKNEEIATALGISIETVKTQKKRAIQSIKEQMGTCYFLLPLCDILYSSKFFHNQIIFFRKFVPLFNLHVVLLTNDKTTDI